MLDLVCMYGWNAESGLLFGWQDRRGWRVFSFTMSMKICMGIAWELSGLERDAVYRICPYIWCRDIRVHVV